METVRKNRIRFGVGVFISVLCLYLAFRSVDFGKMGQSFRAANYWDLIPAIAALFFSHLVRSVRWRYLLDPLRRLDTSSLFSSLIIGYAGNTFMPAHLGELVRAYVLSRKRQLAMSAVFATIVVERITDLFSLVGLMLLSLLFYPFPAWVIQSGCIIFVVTTGILLLLIFLKKGSSTAIRFTGFALKVLPDRTARKVRSALDNLLAGILPLKHWHDYFTIACLSIVIWVCYGLVFYFCLQAFDFVEIYRLAWSASLILLVITTIAVVVPSSPGYVGTYHYLCQITLAMFGVPAGPALSFATVVHGVNIFPVFAVGLFLAHHEGMAITKMSQAGAQIEGRASQE